MEKNKTDVACKINQPQDVFVIWKHICICPELMTSPKSSSCKPAACSADQQRKSLALTDAAALDVLLAAGVGGTKYNPVTVCDARSVLETPDDPYWFQSILVRTDSLFHTCSTRCTCCMAMLYGCSSCCPLAVSVVSLMHVRCYKPYA